MPSVSKMIAKRNELYQRPFDFKEWHLVADILEKHGLKTQAKELRKEAARRRKNA